MTVANEFSSNSKSCTLLLPYAEQKGEHLIRSLVKYIHRTLHIACYTGTKLCTKFNNTKDLVKKSHHHDVVYYVTCSQPGCVEDFTGETGTKLNERVTDYSWRDKNSYL